jgi:protein-S-isoprenylcysteine O-methyltransferase Ste14
VPALAKDELWCNSRRIVPTSSLAVLPSGNWRAVLALGLFAIFLGLNFGLRTLRHWRTTGSSGFRGISGRPGSAEWFGGVLFAIGLLLTPLAPLATLGGWLPAPSPGLPEAGVAEELWVGLALAIVFLGITGVSWAQLAMGASWRIGVREDERTELIQQGPFRWVRNPIFTFMVVAAAGLVLLVPHGLSVLAMLCLALAAQLQVRCAEEPYLRRAHGERYIAYCRRVGRFLPGLGRVRT